MLAPAIPPDEEWRLATLHGLHILDTPPEERFDRLTRLAQRFLDVPIAVVSLVDSDRQWFKSCQGLGAAETPRSISFCGHAILGNEVFVVADATLDPRFADNPLVAGAPHIRFYAGQPLRASNGSRLGTLCIIDDKPRLISQADLEVLRDLAALVENELGFLDTVEAQDVMLRDSEATLSATINTALDAVVHMSSGGIITRWNQQAEKIFGWPRQEAVGRKLHETIIPPQYRAAHIRGMEHFLVSGEGPVLDKRIEMTALHRDGHEFPIELSITPLGLADGVEFSAFIRDITERKLAENLERLRIHTFELLTNDVPLPDILEEIVLWVEAQSASAKCSIMLLDEKSERLLLGAAPSLPWHYKTAMDGILIGDENCACSMVAHTGTRVVFENILTPCRTPHCAMAAQAGIASCWSEPIKSPLGKVQGVFAIYHPDTSSPGKDEIRLLELAAGLAGIAIERKQTEEEMQMAAMVYQGSSEAMMITDADNRIVSINPAFTGITGYSFAEVQGRNPRMFSSGRHNQDFYEAMWHDINTTGRWQGEMWDKRKDGGLQAKWLTINTIRNHDGSVRRYMALFSDITEHMNMLKEMEFKNSILATQQETSPDAILFVDENGKVISRNQQFIDLWLIPENLATADSDEFLLQAAVKQLIDPVGFLSRVRYLYEHREEKSHEELLFKDGRVVDRYSAPVTGKKGEYYGRVWYFRDITERKRSEEIIWKQANFDTLTGLPNRDMFRDRLEQEAIKSHRSGLPLALLLIDLDQFKEVNDTLGHAVGDTLLREAASRIRVCVRESDTVARLGGDEFAVTLPELADNTHVDSIAQKIVSKLAEPFYLGSEIVYISASIGITLFPSDATDIDTLVKNADQAMYAAKSKGRNRFSYFTPALQDAAQARLRLTNDLRGALAAEQFMVYFQPIVELSTGRIHKAEALLRWQHPERGMVGPMEFIPLAEETGFINEIGDWVFEESARWVQRWSTQFSDDFQISVNQSPVQFLDHQVSINVSPVQFKVGRKVFAEKWLGQLHEFGLSGKNIAIEITEGLLLNAESDILNKLLKLRDAGIQVAIDDFGTGYSSLSYLRKFHIDYLKIDQSFVRDLEADPNDMALSRAIIVMAHTLGLKVIAEGVETEGQRNLLAAAGCDYAQGYLFSQPVPPDEFEALLDDVSRMGKS